MVESVKVSISGTTLSLLLYDNMCCDYDQEGFLLGDIIENETQSLTDGDQTVTHKERIIKIKGTVASPQIAYFYDYAGKVDKDKVKSLLGENINDVVGWYKHKRTDAYRFTVSEKIVHKNLLKSFEILENLFLCCLLSSPVDRCAPMHGFSQTFIRYHEMAYQTVPMHIINLSDNSNKYSESEPTSESFNKLVQSLNINKEMSSMEVIKKINEGVATHTGNVIQELATAEAKLKDLEAKVKFYQDKKRELLNLKATQSDLLMEEGKTEESVNLDILEDVIKNDQNKKKEELKGDELKDDAQVTSEDNKTTRTKKRGRKYK